ncbi:GNAT family N-acetyltransferase [Segnochrobactraceae bacterium EtOH-i3]
MRTERDTERAALVAGGRIRLAEAGEIDRMIEIFHDAVRLTAVADYGIRRVRAWAPDLIDREAWRARLLDGRRTFAFEVDGLMIGYADLDAAGHIDRLFVDPAFGRHGVASRLLAHVEAEARAASQRRLTARVSLTARKVFERAGFRIGVPRVVERRGEEFVNFPVEKPLG